MYKGNSGKNRRVVTFLEDFTLFRFYSNFTLTWIYNYLIKNNPLDRGFLWKESKIESFQYLFKAKRIWIAQIENLSEPKAVDK
jgi:hypothetical protein